MSMAHTVGEREEPSHEGCRWPQNTQCKDASHAQARIHRITVMVHVLSDAEDVATMEGRVKDKSDRCNNARP